MSRILLPDRSGRSRLDVPRYSLITQGSDYTFISLVDRESRRFIAGLSAIPPLHSVSGVEAKSLQGQPESYNALTL
jgi:hypothetical protein